MAYEALGAIAGAAITAGTSAALQANMVGKGSKSARHARDFAERMANTSYQRGVADMRAAGLNPALAFGQGGASSPFGVQANYPGPADIPDFGEAYQRGQSTARQGSLAKEQMATEDARQAVLGEEQRILNTKADIESEVGLERAKADIAATKAAASLSTQQAITGASMVPVNEAERQFLLTRDRAARAGIPYSAEQIEAVGKTPIGTMGRAVKGIWRRGLEIGGSTAREIRDNLREKQELE